MSSRWAGEVKPSPPELERSMIKAALNLESAESTNNRRGGNLGETNTPN